MIPRLVGIFILIIAFIGIVQCQMDKLEEIQYPEVSNEYNSDEQASLVNQIRQLIRILKKETAKNIYDEMYQNKDEEDRLQLNRLKQILLNNKNNEVKRSRKQLFSSGLQGVWGVPGK